MHHPDSLITAERSFPSTFHPSPCTIRSRQEEGYRVYGGPFGKTHTIGFSRPDSASE